MRAHAFGVNNAIYLVPRRRLTFSPVCATRLILLVSSRHVFFFGDVQGLASSVPTGNPRKAAVGAGSGLGHPAVSIFGGSPFSATVRRM
jgi:hypothetical protein